MAGIAARRKRKGPRPLSSGLPSVPVAPAGITSRYSNCASGASPSDGANPSRHNNADGSNRSRNHRRRSVGASSGPIGCRSKRPAERWKLARPVPEWRQASQTLLRWRVPRRLARRGQQVQKQVSPPNIRWRCAPSNRFGALLRINIDEQIARFPICNR